MLTVEMMMMIVGCKQHVSMDVFWGDGHPEKRYHLLTCTRGESRDVCKLEFQHSFPYLHYNALHLFCV